MRVLWLVASLILASHSLAEERTVVMSVVLPLGDGIEFAITEFAGCRTAHLNHPVQHGAVFRSGLNDIPYVPGCWERLANGDYRVYIDQWRPEYQVTTVPALRAKDRLITAPKRPANPPSLYPPRVS